MNDSPVRRLIALFDREYDALKAGHLALLAGMAEEKAQLETTLVNSRPSAEDLEILRVKAACNADMLAAAIRGVKAAQMRLAELSQVREVLSVYSSEGEMKRVPTGRSGLERKL